MATIKFEPVPEKGIVELGAENNEEAFQGIERPWFGEAWLVIPADLACDTSLLEMFQTLTENGKLSTYAIYGKPEEIVKAWQGKKD
jgi:hypothetical protein